VRLRYRCACGWREQLHQSQQAEAVAEQAHPPMLSETVTKLAAERAGRWGTSTNTTAAITEALAAEERAARLAQQKKEAEEEKKNAGPAVAHEEEDVEKMWGALPSAVVCSAVFCFC